MRRKLLLRVGGVFCLLLVAVMPAYGGLHRHDVLVSADPEDWTPHVEDGKVFATATVDGITVAVGDFTRVTEAVSGQSFARSDSFAFDPSGQVTAFAPVTNGSTVFDVEPAGDGRSVYIAGLFTQVNGLAGTSRVARVDVHTGAVLQSFRSPGFNSRILDVDLRDGLLYVTGQFTRSGGQPRSLLAVLDAGTGADTGRADLTFSDAWNGGALRIASSALSPAGDRMVVIGNFRNVNGQSRPQIALLDTSGASIRLDSWQTTRYSTPCHLKYATYMTDVDIDPTGTYFAVVTTGAYSGGVSTGTLCDTAARWELAASGPGQQPTWVDYSGGDTITAVEATGTAVYVGGHFRWFNNPFAGDTAGPGAVSRPGIAALNPLNGLPFAWNPKRQRGWGVRGFDAVPTGVWVGNDTDRIGGEIHKRIAFMPTAGGTRPAIYNIGTLPGQLFLLGTASSSATGPVATTTFDGTSSTPFESGPTGGENWDDARGAFMIGRWLYHGRGDGTLQRRYFNGNVVHPPRTVNLHGLTTFANELPNVRSMWFDPSNARLYYTLRTQNRLFYRYFEHRSQTVGAQRFEAVGTTFAWSQATGGFLAGAQLYFASTDGNLNRVDWQRGAPTGAVQVLSGPTVDGRNWSSNGLVLLP
ncbi:MAG TPA: hypothetical protein VHG70_06205 [Nocardioidaceae bacterium]|nr:hypothetical protein [Nocardioidaceae bacterium]